MYFLNESCYMCEKRGRHVHKSKEKYDVFEVVLESDAEMKTFFIDDEHSAALLSKGKHLNRSGIANRWGGRSDASVELTNTGLTGYFQPHN